MEMEELVELHHLDHIYLLLVEKVDDRAFLNTLFEAMYPELPEARKKK